jgi:glutathione S-transferase
MMADLRLYHFPGACSRVTMTALEATGCDYEDVMVNLMAGDHLKPDYRTANPRGKVPALLIDGQLLTENAAILSWIDMTWPDAGLLPKADDAFGKAKYLSDLFWLSSVWHPSVRAMKMPVRWTVGEVEPVRERGRDLLNPLVDALDTRLAHGPWYYGERWSIVDVYFYWAYTTAEEGGYDFAARNHINRHRKTIEAIPAFIATRAREAAARARAKANA